MQSARQQQARSPPSAAKNLQHVPCRFYRSGQCTAGRNCVFSHDLQQETERAPCKYFQKGNCRFGAKCALAHILPDGRRVNHLPRGGPQMAPVFGRIVPENRSFQTSGIHDQLLQSQHAQDLVREPELSSPDGFPALGQQLQQMRLGRDGDDMDDDDDDDDLPLYHQNISEWQETQVSSAAAPEGRPEFFMTRSSDGRTTTAPTQDNLLTTMLPQPRHRSQDDFLKLPGGGGGNNSIGHPSVRTLGPLDAQLPASLDSNGISWFARHGPVAASVPHTSQFGIPEQFTSQTSSFSHTPVQPSTSLFTPNLGTSPRNAALGRAMFGRRVSAINDRTEEPDAMFEEVFVPSSLNELLTPAERQRRDSRGAAGGPGGSDEYFSKSPNGSASGSPSSSRFGLLFSKHKAAEAGGLRSPSQHPTIMPIGSPLARGTGVPSPNPLSPPRINRNASGLRTDMKADAKEFSLSKDREKDCKSEDEPFEMDI